jgi:hypothetical protein
MNMPGQERMEAIDKLVKEFTQTLLKEGRAAALDVAAQIEAAMVDLEKLLPPKTKRDEHCRHRLRIYIQEVWRHAHIFVAAKARNYAFTAFPHLAVPHFVRAMAETRRERIVEWLEYAERERISAEEMCRRIRAVDRGWPKDKGKGDEQEED